MSSQKKFFYISAIYSCCLSLYLATYLTLLSFIAVAICSVTFILIFVIESLKDQKDWKKKEFFKYFLIVSIGFHITIFYNTSAEICYHSDKKDQLFVDYDSFFFGKFFPKGQISLWLDTHPTLNPDTAIGIFINTILQFFYMIYYLIPVISVLGYPLGGCIKETKNLWKNNGVYSENYEKAWNQMYFFGTCFIHSYVPVIFGNTLFPAWSPRLYLEKEYTRELRFYNLIQKISIRKNKSANSFPSGHVSETSVYIYAMHLYGYKKLEIFSFVSSLMIILATMILRYHYFADVCASILIGILAFYAAYRFGYKSENSEYFELESSEENVRKISSEPKSTQNYNIIYESADNGLTLKLNIYTKILMFSFIICSLVCLLERTDYINLLIVGIILYYFIIDKNGTIIEYLRYFNWFLWGVIIMDLIWFRFRNLINEEDPEKTLKNIVYIISICGTIIKFILIFVLRNIKRKYIQGPLVLNNGFIFNQ